MRRWFWWLAAAVPVGVVWAAGCGSSDDEASEENRAWSGGASGEEPGFDASPASGGSTGGVPPEIEIESSFQVPIVTGKHLWSANPESGRIALVDAETLAVKTMESGFGPRYIAALPSADPSSSGAVVINTLSEDASVFRLEQGELQAPLRIRTHVGANAWAVSPSGRWAVAWTNARALEQPDPAKSFQELTLILVRPETGEPIATRRIAGYRPYGVSFNEDESRLFVVDEDGITPFDLSDERAPRDLDQIAVSDRGPADLTRYDVTVTPDGSAALVREEGSATLGLVALPSGTYSKLTLPGAVTDLDLAADGSRAIAVMRAESVFAVIPLPAALSDPSAVKTVPYTGTFGSVSLAPAGDLGVLYTNAIPMTLVATLDLRGAEPVVRTKDVRAPVRGVIVAPDGTYAVALLDPPAGSSRPGAAAVIPLTANRSPIQIDTDAPVYEVATATAPSAHALITVRDDARQVYGVHVVLLSNLQKDYLPLATPPLASGIVPALGKGYVAQAHPEGRITFIDFPQDTTGGTAPVPRARTLTGFELAARIVYPSTR